MEELLQFLVKQKYTGNIKGKSWHSGLCFMKGMETTGRHFQLSLEVVFTPEMVKSAKILPGKHVEIELVN